MAGARQRLVQHGADRRVVVGDEDGSGVHRSSSMSSSGSVAGMGRHQDAEGGAPRLRLAFDDAAMVADDLGDQRQAEAGAVRLRGDEGIEDVGQQVLGHAGAVVDRRRIPAAGSPCCGCPGIERRMPGRKAVRKTISPSFVSPMASAAFFTRFRKTWMSWSRLAWTGGSDGSYSSRMRTLRAKPLRAMTFTRSSTAWMLTGCALGRPLVGEDLHAVDQPDDAVGLVADQARQRAVVLVGVGLQKLRRAADAGERVLDLVRQHRGEAGHRARGAAMRELAVDLLRHGARQQHDRHVARPLGDRRGVDVDDALGAEPRRADVDAVFGDRRAALAAPARSG